MIDRLMACLADCALFKAETAVVRVRGHGARDALVHLVRFCEGHSFMLNAHPHKTQLAFDAVDVRARSPAAFHDYMYKHVDESGEGLRIIRTRRRICA